MKNNGNLYFEDSNNKLYLGDSIEILKSFKKNSIDMIFADPPYGLSNNGITCQNGKMVSVNKGDWDKSKGIEEDFKFHNKWIKACKRILKPNGTIWISGTYHSIYACGFALQRNGFKILNTVLYKLKENIICFFSILNLCSIYNINVNNRYVFVDFFW